VLYEVLTAPDSNWERGVHAASLIEGPQANIPSADIRTLKRPEGRAPGQELRPALFGLLNLPRRFGADLRIFCGFTKHYDRYAGTVLRDPLLQ